MKTLTWFLAAVLLCAGASGAAAATDRETFQKQVSKVAPPSDAKGKALCYCVDQASAAFQNRVGYIRHVVSGNQVNVTCGGDVFDAAGARIGGFGCTTFRPLVK